MSIFLHYNKVTNQILQSSNSSLTCYNEFEVVLYCADGAQFIESYCAAKWYGYTTIIGTVIHMRPII
uniref:Uncharacterized protein n=1 Tax=Rhizophagus irregularis (strain DAOM 181602 / DAOM 197198 / MUCL 43194) TaxID=747089 RepID=U9UDV5_RHIID